MVLGTINVEFVGVGLEFEKEKLLVVMGGHRPPVTLWPLLRAGRFILFFAKPSTVHPVQISNYILDACTTRACPTRTHMHTCGAHVKISFLIFDACTTSVVRGCACGTRV